jgi:hypothetical protein
MTRFGLSIFAVGVLVTNAFAGVKEVYVGSNDGGYAHYVVKCTDGRSYYDLTQKSDGYWHQGAAMSNMGDDYKGLSINEVARKLCK